MPAGRPAAWWRVVLCLSVLICAAVAADDTPPPATPAPTATVAAVPLPEIATRSDDLAVYLKQLEDRLAPDQQFQTISDELPMVSNIVRLLQSRTATTIAASPALREVDDLLAQWQGFQDALSEWGKTLTSRATAIEQEIRGLDDLRAIWRATRDEAQAAGAPPAVRDRIQSSLSLIQQVRKQVESYRETLLVLQDRVVQEAARCREAMDQLTTYRRTAVGRLLVRDSQPIWSPELWSQSWEEALAPSRVQLSAAARQLPDYARLQLPRLPFQIALFILLLLLWRRARQGTARWLAEDHSLSSIAAVFEHPVSSALFLTLLATPWIYPQVPLLLRQAVGIVATPLLLRVLDRLVDRPILPGLYTLGAFFIIDQVRRLLAPLLLIEQLLLLVEMLTGVLVLAWMLRSGRIQRLRADQSPRVVALLERGAQVLLVLLAFALLAGALGFMQLARVVGGAVLGSGYAAMLLYTVQRLAQGVWDYVLRTRTARRLRVVQHYRSLLQERGERLLSGIAALLWIIAVLALAELFDPARDLVRRVLTATFSVGSFSIALGDVFAFGIAVWLSFLLSRFARFVLEEDIYPRVRLARGLPYAFSSILHYAILLVGFLVGLAAAGVQLDRFALLASAFGVGIGFGLQNVVNNFVSGLILLFERPLQVGDTVQIGQLSGEISRIGIRSSTVRSGEGADVIVPNANLIAEPVANWTLTDRMRRLDIAVSVVYGSDPERVLATLRSVATTHPMVVESPAPIALFVSFGPSALTFELRAWTDRFDQWVMIRSELAVAVYKAFAAAGIEMPSAPPPRGEGKGEGS